MLVSPIQSSVERRQNPELPEIQRQSFHGSSSPHATISIPSNRYPMSPQVGSSRNPHAFREHSNLPAVGPASAEAVDQEDEPSHAQNLAQVGASDSGQSPSSNTGSTENIPLMQQLKLRGKWSYRCPHRYNCVKGGVQPNGQLTVFERNSAFRYNTCFTQAFAFTLTRTVIEHIYSFTKEFTNVTYPAAPTQRDLRGLTSSNGTKRPSSTKLLAGFTREQHSTT